MADSPGKKLSQARKAQGISIDEAAHATRIRPDKVLALENDDFSHFPSASYARGFLQIYSRFLSVNLDDALRTLDTTHRVNVGEYQYLNHAPEPAPMRTQVFRADRPPSLVPLMLVLTAVAVVAWLAWQVVSVQRLRLDEPRTSAAETSAEASPAGASAVAKSGAEMSTDLATSDSALAPSQESVGSAPPAASAHAEATTPNVAADTVTSPAAPASAQAAAALATASPATPVAPAASSVPAAAPTASINELVVEPLKTTWVKIREGAADATPIFEGIIYSRARPLKLRGPRFFVEVRDEGAVQIRKNGQPIAYQAPGISVQ